MKTLNFNQAIFSFCLTLLFVSSSSHAEIYKWVDANGQTHYSERKNDPGKAKVLELKGSAQPASTQAASSSPQYWQEQEIQFQQRRANQNKKPSVTPVATQPKSLSGGRSDDTDASRCNLARDVLSGAVRHSNGAVIDEYDRKVAESDIRAYCH